MRRLSFLLAIIGVIVLAILIYNHTRQDRWRPLPGGGKIQLMTVTYGKDAHVKIGGSIFEPLRYRLNARWVRFLGPPPLSGNIASNQPQLVVWFATRFDGNNHLFGDEFSIAMDGRQIPSKLRAQNDATTTEGTRELIGVTFNAVPATESRLHIRLTKSDLPLAPSLDFDADNPRYSRAEQPGFR